MAAMGTDYYYYYQDFDSDSVVASVMMLWKATSELHQMKSGSANEDVAYLTVVAGIDGTDGLDGTDELGAGS